MARRPIAAFFLRLWHRHSWSIPLSIGSAICFARLATEMREGHVDALDLAIEHAVDAWRGSVDMMMLGLTQLGDVPSMGIVTVLVVVALVAKGRRREGRYLFVGACGALAFNTLLKELFQRARPGADLLYLVHAPTSLSFPSGHTMGTTGVVGCIVVVVHVVRAPRLLKWAATVAGIAVVVGVGLSRIYFGAHYPSDVVGGFLAAAAWVSGLTGWTYPRLLPGESAAPTKPR